MAQQPAQTQIVSGQNVIVPAPNGGENITVTSSPSGNLSFEFDATTAEPSRSENDLILTTPDGTVTISDFFAVGDEPLPTLTVAGTTIEAMDFFEGSGMDMTTAAGPAASRADGSGTSYDDGAGSLIDGVDKLGSLGTFQWNRGVEFPEADLGLLGPMGDFTLTVSSEWGAGVIGGVFEDGRPDQYVGNYDNVVAGEITLNFNTGAGTTVGNIVFSGVPKGTFFLGDPSGLEGAFPNGATVLSPDANGNYIFDETQFVNPGVFYVPMEQDANGDWVQDNSDTDINFTISVDFTGANGATITQTQPGTIIVDAVADKPDMSRPDIDDHNHIGGVEEIKHDPETDSTFKDGWHKTEQDVKGTEDVSITIPFSVKTTFYDYDDNSELHSVLVEVPTVPEGADWTCDKGTPVTLWYDGTGNLVGETLPAGADPANYTSKGFIQIPVDNAAIEAAGGTVTIDAKFTVSGKTADINADFIADKGITVNVIAKAEERPSDGELTTANNIAYDEKNDTLNLDIINSKVTIKAGWASEGNNDSKHDSTRYSPDYDGMFDPADVPGTPGYKPGVDDDSTVRGGGAPITISIGGGSGQHEFITELTFTLDADAEGELAYTGSGSLSAPVANPDGSTTYTLTFSNNTTINVDGLHFVPTDGSTSDADVNIGYTVTVKNDAGVQNTYAGEMTVVIDAVADRSENVKTSLNEDGTHTVVVPDKTDEFTGEDNDAPANDGWETDKFYGKHGTVEDNFVIKVKADFPDVDGSEDHFILIQNPGTEWKVVESDLPSDYELVSSGYPGSDGKQYFQIKVPGNLSDIDIDIPFKIKTDTSASNGGSEDRSFTLKTGTLAVEKTLSGEEYDNANNTAENLDGNAISYTLDVINSQLTVKTGWASEGNNDAKYLGRGSDSYRYRGDEYTSTQTTGSGGWTNSGAPIRIGITGHTSADNSPEYIQKIVIKHDGGDNGTFVYKGTVLDTSSGQTSWTEGNATIKYDPNSKEFTFTFTDNTTTGLGTDLVYRPNDDSFSYDDVKLDYTVTIKNVAGSSSVIKGGSTIVIDAVADQSKISHQDGMSDYIDYTPMDPDTGKPKYPEGTCDDYTSAKLGDTVTIKGTVTFPDASGGEEHYFAIDCGKKGSLGTGTLKVTYEENGENKYLSYDVQPGIDAAGNNTLTVEFTDEHGDPQTLVYTITGVNSDGITGWTCDNGDTGSGAPRIPLPNTSSQVDAEFLLTVSSNEGDFEDSSGTIQTDGVEIGITMSGVATVDKAGDDGEYDLKNNITETSTKPNINIKLDNAVDEPIIKIGSAYENAAKSAHEGIDKDGVNHYRNEDFLKDITLDSGRSETALGYDPESDEGKALKYLKDSSAKITLAQGKITGKDEVDDGEFISGVKLSFKTPDADHPGQFMIGDSLIPISGTENFVTIAWEGKELQVSYEVDENGQVTLTILADDGDTDAYLPDVPLYFVPGHDSSSDDIDFDVAISVTNKSNDYTQIFNNEGDPSPLSGSLASDLGEQGIIPNSPADFVDKVNGTLSDKGDYTAGIDAVATKPEFEMGEVQGIEKTDENDNPTGEYYDKLVPGSKVTIPLEDVNLHGDTKDGTENHSLLVEILSGYSVESVELVIEGQAISFNITDLAGQGCTSFQGFTMDGKSGVYHMINLDKAVSEYNKAAKQYNEDAEQFNKDNPTLPPKDLIELIELDDVEQINAVVQTPGDGKSSSIHVGILTNEEWEIVRQDQEQELGNNSSWHGDKIGLSYSSVSSPSVEIKGHAYENATANAHEGNLKPHMPLEVTIRLGDSNDELLNFNLSLADGDKDLGSFWLFESADAYSAFKTAVDGGTSVWEALQTHATETDAIGFNDIKGMVGTNDDGQLTGGFTGQIVYMPNEDSYSGKDPQYKYDITVRDTESGQISSPSTTGTIGTDAVAQKPDGSGTDEDAGYMALSGTSVEKEITVEFTDKDGSTEHFFLIEAMNGWGVAYRDGAKGPWTTVNPSDAEVLDIDGTSYYKIPAYPVFSSGEHTGTDSINVQITPPDNALHWHTIPGGSPRPGPDGKGMDKDFSISVGGLSHEKDTSDGEATFHNNIAFDDSGKIDGILHKPGGIIEQTNPVYEDNQPNQHLGDATEEGGIFDYIMPEGVSEMVISIPTDDRGNPMFVIEGATEAPAGSGTYKITGDDNGKGSFTIKQNPDAEQTNSDMDGSLTLTYTDKDGNPQTISDIPVIVDAVADKPTVSVDYNNTHKDRWSFDESAIHSDTVTSNKGGDDTAKFTIKADFADKDGSESHYLMVEHTPAWVLETEDGLAVVTIDGVDHYLSYTTVFIDGMEFFQIDVTGTYPSDGNYGLGLQYVGTKNGMPDITHKGQHDGVDDYHLQVGAMTKETNLTDSEGDMSNNTSLALDELIVEHSPLDSTGSVSMETSITEGDNVTIKFTGIATDKSDVLDSLTITKLTNSDGTPFEGEIYLNIPGDPPTTSPITIGAPIDPQHLAALAAGKITITVDPRQSHQDFTINWTGEVHDKVSGATDTINDGKTVIIDAVANGSNNTTGFTPHKEDPADPDYTAVQSGKAAVVSVTTEFGDLVNNSENHYVVLEQTNIGYEVDHITITQLDENGNPTGDPVIIEPNVGDWDKYMSTQFDAQGKPYWAVKVPHGNDYQVDFTITTPTHSEDTSFNLGAGTIVVETTFDADGNKEPNYLNNWTSNIENVEIKTGVVETDKAEASGSGLEEGYAIIDFGKGDSDFMGTLGKNNEEVVKITIDAGKIAAKGGALYIEDASWPNGWAPLTPNAEDVYELDFNKNYAFKYDAPHASGTVEFDFDMTIQDTASGATKTLEGQKGSVTIEGVATPPTNLELQNATMEDGVFSVGVTATFADTDGSETHYILVKAVPGLVLKDISYTTVDGSNVGGTSGESYYRISAGSHAGAFDKTLEFTVQPGYDPDSTLEVYGYSVESNGNVSPLSASSASLDIPPLTPLNVTGTDADMEADYSHLGQPVNFTGGTGNETVTGSSFDDIIKLGKGNDYLYGSGGNDELYGGDGIDTLDYSLISGGGIVADLKGGTITFGDPDNGGWEDTISEFEVFKGTDSDDTITATGGMTIYGGKGNDTIQASDGEDVFAWALDDLGQAGSAFTDTIKGFTVGQDKLFFENDVFNMDNLIQAAKEATGSSFSYTDENTGNSLEVTCDTGDSSCEITISKGESAPIQTISLTDCDFGNYDSSQEFANFIQTLIKVDSGN